MAKKINAIKYYTYISTNYYNVVPYYVLFSTWPVLKIYDDTDKSNSLTKSDSLHMLYMHNLHTLRKAYKTLNHCRI